MKTLSREKRRALEDVKSCGDPWHRLPKRSSARGRASAGITELLKDGLAVKSNSGRWSLTPEGEKALEESKS
jgi:hypothetical protein